MIDLESKMPIPIHWKPIMSDQKYRAMIDDLQAEKFAIQSEAQARIAKIDRAIAAVLDITGNLPQDDRGQSTEPKSDHSSFRDTARDQPSDSSAETHQKSRGLKWIAEQIIRQRGNAVSVEELKNHIINNNLYEDKPSLYNSLYSAMSKDSRFKKTAPGVFIMTDMIDRAESND
jgi:hypothetical protein